MQGPNDDGKTMASPGKLTLAAMEDSIRFGRGGRGSIYVWAAGNGQADRDQCNYDGYANSRYTITVGAYDYNGQQAYYSESCAALTVVAPSSGAAHYINTASTNNQCSTRFGGTSAAWYDASDTCPCSLLTATQPTDFGCCCSHA